MGENQFWQPVSLPEGEILCATQTGPDNVLVGIGNTIIHYNHFSFSYNELMSDIKAERMKYEELTDNLYVSTGNTLYVFSYPECNMISSVILNDSILDFHFQYTK